MVVHCHTGNSLIYAGVVGFNDFRLTLINGITIKNFNKERTGIHFLKKDREQKMKMIHP